MKKEIKIKDLSILINMGSDFERLNSLLEIMQKNYPNKRNLLLLTKMMKKEKKFFGKRKKEIYEPLQQLLKKLKHYPLFGLFLFTHYDKSGKPKETSPLKYYYEYIKMHQNDITKIKALITALQEKNIYTLTLEENNDFLTETYHISKEQIPNKELTMLEHIKIISTDDTNEITYQTTSSNYKIKIPVCSYQSNTTKNIKIYVNNLLFDPILLPQTLSKKDTYDKILKLEEEKQEEKQILKSEKEISQAINNWKLAFIPVEESIASLPASCQNSELTQALIMGQQAINQLIEAKEKQVETVKQKYPEIATKILVK